jgi:hypothetical protein
MLAWRVACWCVGAGNRSVRAGAGRPLGPVGGGRWAAGKFAWVQGPGWDRVVGLGVWVGGMHLCAAASRARVRAPLCVVVECVMCGATRGNSRGANNGRAAC